MTRSRTYDLVLLAVAVVAISTAAPLIRAATAPALAVAFWRVAPAAPLTAVAVVARHWDEGRSLDRRTWLMSGLAGLFLAGHFAAWVSSLAFTSVASSVALVSTMPVWAALFARLRGDVVPAPVWRGIALAVGGVVLLTGVDLTISARAVLGDVLALVGGILAALYVTIGAQVRRQTSTTLYTALCYSVGSLVLLVACVAFGERLTGYDGWTWLALAALVVGPQLLGHSMVNRVLGSLSPTVVSVALLFEIVGAAVLAWVFLGEVPPLSVVPAAALIAGGVIWVLRAERPNSTVAPRSALSAPAGRRRRRT